MKKIIIFLFTIVLGLFFTAQLNALPCCYYVDVSHSIDENCCLKITVQNPYCGEHIMLQIKDGSTWVTEEVDSTGGTVIVFTYCPDPGENPVEYRVRLVSQYDNDRPSVCFDSNHPYEFTEGINQYSGSADMGCCAGCPEDYEDWLVLSSKKDNSCPDNGCEITHSLNIPSGVDCYTSYRVETDSSSVPPTPLTGSTLNGIDRCIAAGTSFNVKVVLYKTAGSSDSCVIEKSVNCDEPRDTNQLQEPCTPDCFETPWGPPDTAVFHITACAGFCLVKATFLSREACNTWYDIQIIRMELSTGCDGCSLDLIYQQTLLGIIAMNPMGYPPLDSGCSTTWRVANGGCWSDWTYYVVDPTHGIIDTIKVLEPCTMTECCLQPMTVCKDSTGGPITISYDSLWTPYIDCDDTWLEDPYTGWIFPCYPKCDWLAGLEGTHYPPSTSGKQGMQTNKSESKIGVNLQYFENNVQLILKNKDFNNAIIGIYDINGRLMIENSKSLHDGDNYVNISTSELNRGAYIINIIVDGIELKSDKFIVE